MEFEWDDRKATINLAKHGVDFADAIRIFLDPFRVEWVDERSGDRELRYKAMGRLDNLILLIVYTERRGNYRIISSRRATKNERRIYEEG